MEDPNILSELISFLKSHDYPLIHGMSFDETAEVFHKSNRCFVVCWALNLLNEDYGCMLKGREKDETFLADIVCCHGFCTEKEKAGFIDGSLDICKQLQIFYIMFNFIDEVRKSEALTEEVKPITLEDLDMLENKDLNLFPHFAIKPLSNEENESIKDQENILKEIYKLHLNSDNIQLETENHKSNYAENALETKMEFTKTINSKISKNLSQFENIVNKVQKMVQEKEILSANKIHKYEINPLTVKLFAECNENLHTVSKYMKNLETINNFEVEDLVQPDDTVFKLIALLADQIKQ